MGRYLNGKYVSSGQRTLASVEGVSRVRERCECGSDSNADKLIKENVTCYNQIIVAIVDVLTSFIFIFTNDNR
jgi:hypothetical protein